MDKIRCVWCNLKNPKYIEYHDKEWGVPIYDDKKLYELFILECFQAGLSWECILNKRDYFRMAYDNFDIDKIINYDDVKISELLNNQNIIRNKLKVLASITNSRVVKEIQKNYGSFSNYIWSFTDDKIIQEEIEGQTTSELSDRISKDMKKRGMKFVGSVTIYSFLQAAGIINAHSKECWLYKNGQEDISFVHNKR